MLVEPRAASGWKPHERAGASQACFLGADAVTAERGICEASLEQIRLKELMIGASDRVVVLAHS